jgi:hypothetical protein
MKQEEFAEYLALVRAAQDANLCTVLLGIEADYQRDLVGEHLPAVLDSAEFDLVLARSTPARSGTWRRTIRPPRRNSSSR